MSKEAAGLMIEARGWSDSRRGSQGKENWQSPETRKGKERNLGGGYL